MDSSGKMYEPIVNWEFVSDQYQDIVKQAKLERGKISKETIEYIDNHTNITYYGGDSDDSGKRASYIITAKLGYKHINPPDYLLDNCCKDFADMAKFKGLKSVEEHFKIKGIYEY